MTNILLGLLSAALLSSSSLVVVLVRVSPLTDPGYAIPFFFGSVFLSVSTLSSLAFFGGAVCRQRDRGEEEWVPLVRSSLRRGFLVAAGTCVVILFHLLQVLTWWIAALVYGVVILLELAFSE